MPDLFIDGEWRGALDGRTREIRCPADGSLVGVVDEAGGRDTAQAIAAARRAFDEGPWPRTPAQERGDLLLRVAALLMRDKDALARAESLDTGKRLVESAYDIDDVANCFRYFGEEEAVRLANDTVYGLAGAVWTGGEALAARVAARLRLGTVWINDYHPYVPQAEWGGFKQSGFGRELGPAGLAEYRETKHIWRNTRPTPQGWFD
ncbi:aldehyde dehydrogenase family protein [Streptomyces luteogriseus]|uniref:aldehyde dehydrogenase family protein n=1 Tax=Streptomyces luteogriseus TaxID=68233 RepID=UPI003792A9B3